MIYSYEHRGDELVVIAFPRNPQDQRILNELSKDGIGSLVIDEIDDRECFMLRRFTRESYDYLVEAGAVGLPTFEEIIKEAEEFTKRCSIIDELHTQEIAQNLREIALAKEAHPGEYESVYHLAFPVAYQAAKEAFEIASPQQRIHAVKEADAKGRGEIQSTRRIDVEVVSHTAFSAVRKAFAEAYPEKSAIMEAASADDILPLDMLASAGGLKKAVEDAVKKVVSSPADDISDLGDLSWMDYDDKFAREILLKPVPLFKRI